MSESTWPEITSVKSENRHELILSGAYISKRLEDDGIDNELFNLTGLNFLNISDTCLWHVSSDIGNLVNLTNLVLHSNKIEKLPVTIGKLTKLKVLDLSRNKLELVPDEISKLTQLSTLNLGSNALKEIPSLVHNTMLSILDLSLNQFEEFPSICHPELMHLAEVKLNGNKINDLPSSIGELPSLKLFDLGDNAVTLVPGELADCNKLKEVNLKGNKLTDKRLLKMVEQCHSKQVLEYVRQHCPRSGNGGEPSGKGKKGKKGKKGSHADAAQIAESVERLCHKMQVIHVSDETPCVRVVELVKTVRAYIVCCIVRGVRFTPESLKKFIQLQTKLHDTVCGKRNAATIATHDLDLLAPGNLTYTALPPDSVVIRPLMRARDYTGQELFSQLQKEADDLRKEKKRKVYTGIHKFLYLLEGKPVYPVLLDSSERVISFPPMTNSDITKLSADTKAMFVEVTSTESQMVCRKVLDTLLGEMLTLGIGDDPTSPSVAFHSLSIEQVKIVDLDGNLKSVYPARNDLTFDSPNMVVVRE